MSSLSLILVPEIKVDPGLQFVEPQLHDPVSRKLTWRSSFVFSPPSQLPKC